MGTIDRIGSTELIPGTTYYVRTRYRDVYGNLSLPTTATSVVIRYTDQVPGARVFRSVANKTEFPDGAWAAFPFTNKTSSPAFDTLLNYQLSPDVGSAAVPALTNPPAATAAYFRMPCDGRVFADARVGVWNTGSFKADIFARFGLMRIGSTLPGGNASTPVVPWYIGVAEGSAGGATTYLVGATVSSLFVNISGSLSAHSGDYIALGVYAEGSGLVTMEGDGSNSCVSTSYAHFTVVQD